MSDKRLQSMPEEFEAEVRDALSRFYDSAYLLRHPLLHRLGLDNGKPNTSVQQMRRALLEAIEQLRPAPGVPADDPAHRPFAVLHQRYILGKEIEQVEADLSLGRRQRQREQQRGLQAVAATLWARGSAETETWASRDDVLWQEISRTADEWQSFELREQFERVLSAVQALADQYQVILEARLVPVQIEGNPSLCRQLFIAILSALIRSDLVRRIFIDNECRDERVSVRIRGSLVPQPEKSPMGFTLPDAIHALARAQQAMIVWEPEEMIALRVTLVDRGPERRVVIVEDNQDVVALFCRYLARSGYRLLALAQGERLLDRIVDAKPEVILLDVMMSHMGGWEILQQLKSDPRTRSIPVIVCSVLDEPELAASLGADATLCKPVRRAQLLQCLQQVLNR